MLHTVHECVVCRPGKTAKIEILLRKNFGKKKSLEEIRAKKFQRRLWTALVKGKFVWLQEHPEGLGEG